MESDINIGRGYGVVELAVVRPEAAEWRVYGREAEVYWVQRAGYWALQCEEAHEGVLVGVGECLKGVSEGETSLRKTLWTLIKLGGRRRGSDRSPRWAGRWCAE